MLPATRDKVAFNLNRFGTDMVTACQNHFPSIGKDNHYPTLEAAVLAETPTLPMFDNMYDMGASVKWLEVQITEVLMFTGLREKMSQYQRSALARQLRSMGVDYCVTMSEFMQFFSHFERGDYKMFQGYERPNPQVVTDSFTSFLYDLRTVRNRIQEQQEWEQKRKEEAEHIAVPPPPELLAKWQAIQSNPNGLFGIKRTKDNRLATYVLTWTNDGTQTEPMTFAQIAKLTIGRQDSEYTIKKVTDG